MGGVPGATKKNPYAGPVYSSGTKEMDAKNNQGSVAGPKGGMSSPDPMNLKINKNKGGK